MTKQLSELLNCNLCVLNVFVLTDRIALCTNLVGVAGRTAGLKSPTIMIQHQKFCEPWKLKRYGFANTEVCKCCMA
jgi:hypothetical protein